MSEDMFEIDLDNINIEDIMNQIRANIKAKGIVDEEISFNQVSSEEDMLSEYLRMTNNFHNINPHQNIMSHRKFIGSIIVFIKKIIRKSVSWYINPIIEQQNEFNAYSTRTLNSMNAKFSSLEEKNKQIEEKNKQMKNQMEQIENKMKGMEIKIEKIVGKIKEEINVDNKIKCLEEKNEENRQLLLKNLEYKENEMENKFNSVYEGIQYNNLKLKRIERKLKYGDISVGETKYLIPEKEKLDFDYFLFEEKYRGSQENIKNKLNEYLKYFEKEDNILDIGCGRGEFLEILRENKIEAKGIEIDEDMLLLCKEKNLNVENVDALMYLSNLEDNSLGGIILTQVIEHLEPNYLIKLITLAYEKLKPGAYFIAETINPQSLIVFTEAYFMDLSHIRMIHPYTAKFLVESEGFKEISIKYSSKVGDDLRIPEVSELPTEFNQAIGRLNDVVYGYRDYAIIGRK